MELLYSKELQAQNLSEIKYSTNFVQVELDALNHQQLPMVFILPINGEMAGMVTRFFLNKDQNLSK